ncbi:hypothetical protein [Phenylobacterium sp.]|uniref:hypothetical protein n=1 Tax=Phenylobacterium sp. TaxID=1871053 RepID=UPI002812179D|nr:hypothetical protein [Phenylobacterium sp.]
MAQMFQTLARTLLPHQGLGLECARCGRRATWPRDEAMRRLGPDSTPADVRRRLKCAGCGAREAVRLRVV